MTRKAKSEEARWLAFYSLLAELQPSPAAKRAREIVFGQNAARTLPASPIDTREKTPKSPERMICVIERQLWLSGFRVRHPGVTDASIYRAVKVDRRDWHRWKNGELPDSSTMALRIKKMLFAQDSPHSPH